MLPSALILPTPLLKLTPKFSLMGGYFMKTIEYYASASFDITTTVEVKDNADDLEIWLSIINDLENRYDLTVSYKKEPMD